jgi:ubiquinone/menaquinone biosynthesis C-methylase UbiE
MRIIAAAFILLTGAAQAQVGPLGPAGLPASRFPPPARQVASIISDRWASEDQRERAGESTRVMDFLHVHPGMAVADIGAGNGYYTERLSRRVGPMGRVLAEDVVPEYLATLQRRVTQSGLRNVTVGLGDAHDPRLPPASVDLALLVHMYHEIQQPFGLMVNLLPALRPGARVAIIDTTRPTQEHGTPPALLDCELNAVGYRRVATLPMEGGSEYLAVFEPPAKAPAPETVRPCSPK